LTLPVSLLRPPSLSCIDADTCAIFGIDQSGNSTFLETTDGGQTWTSRAGPNELAGMNGPMQLACTTATSCLVVAPGPNRKVDPGSTVPFGGAASFVTDDGGSTWSADTLPSIRDLGGILCPTSSACVAGGRNQVLYTTNGGSTWFSTSVSVSAELPGTQVTTQERSYRPALSRPSTRPHHWWSCKHCPKRHGAGDHQTVEDVGAYGRAERRRIDLVRPRGEAANESEVVQDRRS